MEMRFGGARRQGGLTACFPPPFQGLGVERGVPRGSAFGSTLGYVPAAASRLRSFGISPGGSPRFLTAPKVRVSVW